MRKLMVVSRIFLPEMKRKLLVSPFRLSGVAGRLGRTVRKVSTFRATGSKGVVILFPRNALRHCTGLPATVTVLVVEGSKICPFSTAVPSHGLVAPVGAPKSAEKSPPSSAGVGNVVTFVVPGLFLYCS